jgi:hypothetical protein
MTDCPDCAAPLVRESHCELCGWGATPANNTPILCAVCEAPATNLVGGRHVCRAHYEAAVTDGGGHTPEITSLLTVMENHPEWRRGPEETPAEYAERMLALNATLRQQLLARVRRDREAKSAALDEVVAAEPNRPDFIRERTRLLVQMGWTMEDAVKQARTDAGAYGPPPMSLKR